MDFPKKLNSKLIDRRDNNSLRELYNKKALIDFSSNDYLGFSKNKHISIQVAQHLEKEPFINGSTGSRLLSGNHALHEDVENELANFFIAPAALIFNSGYDANIGLLSSVPQHGDIILFDELCHASIRDGIRLSHAKSYSFKHNDLADLKKKFSNTITTKGNTYLIVESIYSMDGDAAPMMELVEFCKNKSCYLIVDEAHSSGVYGDFGKGLIVELGLENDVFARVHTFGKALGCHGAVVVGSEKLRTFLINYARSFIYTTALPLHSILTIKYSVNELLKTNELFKLKSNIAIFKNELKALKLEKMFIDSNSPIQCCIIQNATIAKKIARDIRSQNYDIKAILSPTVPKGKERLRMCIHSYNSLKEIKDILKLLSTFVQKF
jgi:8-amino-7-oxononanoate synthase